MQHITLHLMACCLLSNACVATSFYQRPVNHVSFLSIFRNQLVTLWWRLITFTYFRQCGQLRGDIQKLCIFSLQMLQRCCRPWQVSCFLHRANELCKRTGETLGWGSQSTIDYINHRGETHCKKVRVSRNATPFRDLTKLRTTDHRTEYLIF